VSPRCSLRTLHRHNIFDAQLTRSQQEVVSCGADGCVCVTQVDTLESHRRLLFEPDGAHHIAAKIALMKHSSPDAFLVTFSDGYVRMFDLREAEHRVAVTTSGVGLTAIELKPSDHVTLATGGNDAFLRIFDLRSLSFTRENHSRASEPATPVVSIHTEHSLLDLSRGRRRCSWPWSDSDVGISGVSWSADGRRLLANYRNHDVVLFDMLDTGTTPAEVSPVASAIHDRIHLNVACSYKGRVNEQTCAKEVRFLCGDAAVGTGGDCGNFFIWETATGKLQRKLKADRCVVNCVAPHPCQPMVCTSGIDAEIKVWDVGDDRARLDDERKRSHAEGRTSPTDWARRRREAAPNVTLAQAEERLKTAEQKKTRGNALVRQANWSGALELYQNALRELHFLAPTSETQKAWEALANSCRLNCALCSLHLEDYHSAAEYCTKVLHCDEANMKALFRRASALGALREFDEAIQDLDAALLAEPGNVDCLRLRTKLQRQQRQHMRRRSERWRRLFSESAATAAAAAAAPDSVPAPGEGAEPVGVAEEEEDEDEEEEESF